VLLWFVGPSILAVWAIFRSPGADYRFVAVGSLIPLVELPLGSPRLLHSVTGAALAMTAAMVLARGQRLRQRQLLGLAIGMLLHLVLDGAWTDAEAFWWPFLGTAWSTAELPELGRGPLNLLLELAGLASCWWGYRRFRLDEPERRSAFIRTGRVGRDIVP
jgi:membrane-bound metal-dependent hydrolase YbcI (DUF457 family)